MKIFKRIGLIAAGAAIMACSAYAVHHDEDLAGRRALEFVQAAILNHDISAAYDQFADETKPTLTKEKLAETLSRMHPSSVPTAVKAVSYEFFQGQPKIVTIALVGENLQGDSFYYRISLAGTKATDYKILGIARDQGPMQLSNLGRNFKPSDSLIVQSTAPAASPLQSPPLSQK